MGIYDPEKGCFTGECYEEGYILGLEKLSESEQNEYLALLEKASESAKLGRKIDKEYEVLDNEISREMILLNYAQAGFINGAVSEEKAQRLVEIYNNANPFNEKIKNIEQRRQQLWLKGNKPEEDLLLLEQYSTVLENGSRPVSNHNFTANGGVSFKGFSANVQFNDTDSPMAHSNTYGLKLSHDFGNYGRLGLEGSYQKTKNKIEPNVDENITVSANYTLNF